MAFISFDETDLSFLSSNGGKTSLTDKQCKSGKKSLKWEYITGSALDFKVEIGYEAGTKDADSRMATFAMYVYGIEGEGSLEVVFLKGEEALCGFNVHLGFNGWRHIAAVFDRDMNGSPTDNMDGFRITAHGKGIILLDEIVTSVPMDIRFVMASEQIPDISNKVVSVRRDFKLKEEYKPDYADSRVIEKIASKYRKYVIDEFDTGKSEDVLIERAKQYNIKEDIYGTVGEKIEHTHQRGYLRNTEYAKEKYFALRETTDLMCDISIRYAKTNNPQLRHYYILLLKHLINQGFAFGSTLGTHMILDYSLRPFCLSLIVMQAEEELKPFLEELKDALCWFTHIETRGYFEGQKIQSATADDFFNLAPGMMAMALIMPDDIQKAWSLKALSGWLDYNMKCTVGLEGMFKEDGCIFHHRGHYPAYGNGALTGIAPILYAVANTEFDVGEDARQNMRNVLLALRFQAVKTLLPLAFSGRHPYRETALPLIPYRYFALYMLEHGDEEMAKVFLRLAGIDAGHPDRHTDSKVFEAEKIPEGNKTFPMACANVHRRDNWMLVAKGFSKYIWGSEIYCDANLYGRYRSYGAIELCNDVENTNDRYKQDGFDWSRIPGTTAINLPLDELKARIYNVDVYSGFEEMLISDRSFAGGNTLDDNGMFSMILAEHPKYNGTFKAYKSVFMYEDFIVAVGSNVTAVSDYETETTLFQNRVLDGDMDIHREGNRIYDNRGNIFYLKGDYDVYLHQGHQMSKSAVNSVDTEGDFAVAVIRHGKCPDNQTYAYGIGVNGADEPDWEIIRQDEKAHIVRICDTTYMAIFEPGTYCDIKTNIPVMIMLKHINGKLKVALSNPDLLLYDCDNSQFDEKGKRKEVSIWSRNWTKNPLGVKNAEIFVGDKSFNLCLRGGDIATITL